MADVIKLVNATKLDADLTSVSHAIQDLDPSFGSMSFPSGMIENLTTAKSIIDAMREDNGILYSQVESLTHENEDLTSQNSSLKATVTDLEGYISSEPHYMYTEGSTERLNMPLPAGIPTNSIVIEYPSDFIVIVINNTASDTEDHGHKVWICSINGDTLYYESIINTGRLHTENYGNYNLQYNYDYYPVYSNGSISFTSTVRDYSSGKTYQDPVGWSMNQSLWIIR